jgi:caffeoyl-CoA O-methyltransferase
MTKSKINQEMIMNYCENHSHKNSPLLIELEKYTWDNEDIPQMISGQLVGNFLQLMIQSIQAKNILEIGMFTGFSALKMAEVLPNDGELHTCEIMDKHVVTAQSFFNRSNHGKKINIHLGPALINLEQMKVGHFDLAFIDADKINYLEYYKRCFRLLRSGGIIILDNMLWSGNVVDPKDDDSIALRKTGDFINEDNRVTNMLFPIRDGLMVCLKNEE